MSKRTASVLMLSAILAQLKSKGAKVVAPLVVIIGLLSGLTGILGINLMDLIKSTGILGAGQSNTVTVLVHGVGGKDQLVLPSRGFVKLIYGDAIVSEQINNEGEATFKQIPDDFFQAHSNVEIIFEDPEGEPYRAVHIDSTYKLNKGEYLSLPVKLHGLDRIYGVIRDFETSDPIDSVRVSVQGTASYSNQFGEFELIIPPDKQQQFQTIHALKEGYETYQYSNLPVQTGRETPILLKPKTN